MEIAKVFVIIVTYNGKQWYDRCFQSLRNSTIILQTIVVDNASTDDTVEYIKSHFPEIILLQSQVNLGFGQGNNKGIRYALDQDADYVFLLNQDAWIESDTIAGLVKIHQQNTDFGILSPMHLNAEKTTIEKGLLYYIADYQITTTDLINDLYFSKIKDVYESQYINAAAWLLPRQTMETVGGFDPIFFHYGEDDNYIDRVHYHGYMIGLCPLLIISHDTERAVKKTIFTSQSAQKTLLRTFTDINRGKSIYKFVFYSLRKAFLKSLKLKFSLSCQLLSDAMFIWKSRNSILESRRRNRMKSNTWL